MRALLQRQLDSQLKPLQLLRGLERPQAGWLKTIRKALGMTQTQVGKKLSRSPQAIDRLEKSEKKQTITLNSLDEVAQALNCRVVYLLIPEKPILEQVEQQMQKKAHAILAHVHHSMTLEQQGTTVTEQEHQLKELVEEMRRKENISFIWETEKKS